MVRHNKPLFLWGCWPVNTQKAEVRHGWWAVWQHWEGHDVIANIKGFQRQSDGGVREFVCIVCEVELETFTPHCSWIISFCVISSINFDTSQNKWPSSHVWAYGSPAGLANSSGNANHLLSLNVATICSLQVNVQHHLLGLEVMRFISDGNWLDAYLPEGLNWDWWKDERGLQTWSLQPSALTLHSFPHWASSI